MSPRRSHSALAGALLVCSACGGPEQNPKYVTAQQQGLQVCAGPSTVPGIDVSEYQGSIDWGAVAGAGFTFAITRINDGYHSDPYFGANWAGIKAAGMVRGAYQFYEPTIDSTTQANWVIGAVGVLGPGDLPVVLDVEWTSGTPNAGAIQDWVNQVAAGTGKIPIIYTAEGYWDSYFSTEFGNLDLWVANYGPSCPYLPSSWGGWLMWQWGGGPVAGIAGDVDQDVFNGTLDDLHTAAGQTANSGCTAGLQVGCSHYGCNCADGTCSGGFCAGTGCSAAQTAGCGAFGCGCVDQQCNGVFCPGTGCTAKETNDCGAYGCGCADHQCNGVFCPGTGCTARETNDCGAYGCGCVDHQCNGVFCQGSGCTARETLDCTNQGCGCVDHQCNGGACAGNGCTARDVLDCGDAGCSMAECTTGEVDAGPATTTTTTTTTATATASSTSGGATGTGTTTASSTSSTASTGTTGSTATSTTGSSASTTASGTTSSGSTTSHELTGGSSGTGSHGAGTSTGGASTGGATGIGSSSTSASATASGGSSGSSGKPVKGGCGAGAGEPSIFALLGLIGAAWRRRKR
ncbi:MAG: hypothetical protein JST54_15645 [Deltaproteobacteria bacterium]|nr:hypothetical protein [Deltaproteobacteria bacterium]